MFKIKAVIFDCDGTLVDSESLSARLLRHLLQQHGHALDEATILHYFRGRPYTRFLDDISRHFPRLDQDLFSQQFRQQSLQLLASELETMPGAHALLAALQLPRCIASNGPREKIETSLNSTGLKDYFGEAIISAYEVHAWKPDPALIHHALRLLDVAPADCLLVEDSASGIAAGLAAGVAVAGVHLDAEAAARFAGQISIFPGLPQLAAALGLSTNTGSTR
ncbi:HAD-IA family hydrolase [Aquitalea sp. LB_tupeE]|uniref:HAD family hydrolase n=1 Tax=Aquitalea sp. LB_tupeE TaxID=2748078 RepID=UPI0015C18B3A|nr:HAD-IA family hydrolase [Aquitalea sp. LB_tupeE]